MNQQLAIFLEKLHRKWRREMVPVEIIKKCKIFKMFPDELIEEIASIGVEISYKANEILFNIDDPAKNLSILVKGRVDIMTTKRTQLVLVQTIYPGEPFGMSSMITGHFTAAAKVIEDSVIAALPADKLERILEKDYRAAFQFMKQIALKVSSRLLRMHYQLDITGSGYI
jgi:CRP-like cAMP-binding protein